MDEAGTTAANCVVIIRKLHWLLESGKGRGRNKQYPAKVEWLDQKTYLSTRRSTSTTRTDSVVPRSWRTRATTHGTAPSSWRPSTRGRLGEIASLRVKDVVLKERYAEVRLRGKTGDRVVSVARCVPYLITWLNHHPDPQNPDAPLWVWRNGEGAKRLSVALATWSTQPPRMPS